MECCFISYLMLAAGCKGEKGDVGPAGPTGNANVHSIQFTVGTADWKVPNVSGLVYYTKTSPLITADVVSGGTVLLYYQFSSNIWTSLPEDFVTNTNQPYSIRYVHGLSGGIGALEIYLFSSNSIKFDAIFKAVIIDGTLDLSKVNIHNYNDVREHLNLSD